MTLTSARLRTAALVAALALLAPSVHAQLRLTRSAPVVAPAGPDSVVKAIVTGGSAKLVTEPTPDAGVPSTYQTKAERTNWKQTSDHDETMRFCRMLEVGSRWVKVTSFGRSGQGRDLPLVIVSKDMAFTPEAARATGKPVVLIQNGIHAGEIEGKDAALMLVRDLAVLKQHEELLDSVIVLVVPMLSPDGLERRSRYNRINQNGPEEMGWRHTAIGLNLNRDYAKLDSPELQGLIGKVYSQWWPELLVDDHTTDGADYRYDITYATNHGAGVPTALDRWMGEAIEKNVMTSLAAKGHIVGPYLDFRQGGDPRSGIEYGNAPARFSTGYAPTQSRAALLVETHMLKPYGSRVKATYDLLLSLLEELHARPRALVEAVRSAEAEAVARATNKDAIGRLQVLSTTVTDKGVPFAWKGVATRWERSDITGGLVPRYSSTPWDTTVTLYRQTTAQSSVRLPAGGYLVPQEWTDVIERLALHGIRTRRVSRAWSDSLEMTRVTQYTMAPTYEGRTGVQVTATRSERQWRTVRAGDVWVPLDQRGGPLAVQLLEASSPDGFLAWGFFNTVFQRKEYGADYVVEPLARFMMERDPALAAEFRAKVAADTAFAKSPEARIDWFYRRSLWTDREQDLHPIARLSRPVPEANLVALPKPATPPVATPAPKR